MFKHFLIRRSWYNSFISTTCTLHNKFHTLFQQTGKINKEGYLIIKSEKTRKQILNQADCLDKVRHMIFQACVKPKELTEEDKQKIEKRYCIYLGWEKIIVLLY